MNLEKRASQASGQSRPMMWAWFAVACALAGSQSYARSRTAFAFFTVGLLNTFCNYGHHTYHLPQSAWIHWASFIVSMLELVILAKIQNFLSQQNSGDRVTGLAELNHLIWVAGDGNAPVAILSTRISRLQEKILL